MKTRYDVLIVGAGVVGNAIARELSRYKINVAVFGQANDLVGILSFPRFAIYVLHFGGWFSSFEAVNVAVAG